jgi:tetratricopeptide (TPR) repeat protein
VPSARELAQMGPLSRVERSDLDHSLASIALAIALGPLSLTGCDRSPESAPSGAVAPASSVEVSGSTSTPAPGAMPMPSQPPPSPPSDGPSPTTPTTVAPPSAAPVAGGAPEPEAAEEQRAADGDSIGSGSGYGAGGGGTGEGSIGLGSIGAIGRGGSAAGGERDEAEPQPTRRSRVSNGVDRGMLDVDETLRHASSERAAARPSGGVASGTRTTTRITTIITTTTSPDDHARRRCSDAAQRSLDDRRALWRERLVQAGYVGGWIEVYRNAIRDCEATSWRERRALLALVIEQAGTIESMIQLYQYLPESAARAWMRSEIFRRVRTPEHLRLVRQSFGLGSNVDWALVSQVLARATTPQARIRALRSLVQQIPGSFELKLRLLSELETQRRTPEALRLALALRADALADPGVRTAVGEMYLRMNREDDARRAFSEIVEFAPLDELARRRLGDLDRAHGWYDDAYRQYQTLAAIRPDDPSALLLLAQAAAGAGRVDEALRLEQRLMETASPGAVEGIARVAQLWSSVRFAELRKSARDASDDERLAALVARMRRSGVLRDAGDLRVTLTWSHPDAQLALWAAHPGLTPTRPDDLAPELGIEAFDVTEQEDAPYRIEVRQSSTDPLGVARAQLTVVWNEGRSDERIEILPLELGPTRRAVAWTIQGTTITPITLPAPVASN